MLDQMSGGRFLLGVGRGVSIYETQAYGLDFSKTQEMYHEASEVLLKGLGSEELDFHGKYYNFDKLPMVLRPVQRPHPPLWYGLNLPNSAAWPAENSINTISLGLRDHTGAVIASYRAARVKAGLDPNGTLMGIGRHVVVADTDEEALAIARRAYPRWRESFRWLFARHGAEPRVIGIYPPTFDEIAAMKNAVAGSPATVKRFLEEELAASEFNYFAPWLAFGSMTLKETLRSVELFASEVMPAFAKARPTPTL